MALIMRKNALCSNPMDWMIVTPSVEEELSIERSVREVQGCDDNEMLRHLCEALVRQSWHQGKLLAQAVNHIASLDDEFD
tara:strand:- start:714 stop:953 length:240 start_codon:yes stop_codon:yes gene_type:complete